MKTIGYRKKAHLQDILTYPCEELKVYVNRVPLKKILQSGITYPQLKEVISKLKGQYHLSIIGGGFCSQLQIIEKTLFNFLSKEDQLAIKKKFILIDRTDSRRKIPKKFGGPGARARFQKSYR